MRKNEKKKKVFVAMSGGVDSSVAAALLKKGGFDVVGVFMKCWDANDPFGKSCTAPDDERSARLAAEHIGVPFYSWNFVKEYKERVVDYMLRGYANGITPNPDMMCNKEIKFGLFFDKAMALGADAIATGHYARLRREFQNPYFQFLKQSKAENSRKQHIVLLEGADKNKDQSYFLSFIKPEVLECVFFPIGEYTKPKVRELARTFGLPNAERKDSQGVCFIGKLNFSEFLRAFFHEQLGPIKDIHGGVIGSHRGLSLHTIGQRKGIGLSGGPYYVVAKDQKTNTLLVSKNEKDLFSIKAIIRNINWFSQDPPASAIEVGAKTRYRQKSALATLAPLADEEGAYILEFKEPQRAITPGQFAVLYQGEAVLGGGIIS